MWLGRVLSIHRISTVYLTSNIYAYLRLFWLRWNGLSKHSQWLAHIDIDYVHSVLNAYAWHVIYFEYVFWWQAHVYRMIKKSHLRQVDRCCFWFWNMFAMQLIINVYAMRSPCLANVPKQHRDECNFSAHSYWSIAFCVKYLILYHKLFICNASICTRFRLCILHAWTCFEILLLMNILISFSSHSLIWRLEFSFFG